MPIQESQGSPGQVLERRIERTPGLEDTLVDLTEIADLETLRRIAENLRGVPVSYEERRLPGEGGEILIRVGVDSTTRGMVELIFPQGVSVASAPSALNSCFRAKFPGLERDAICESTVAAWEGSLDQDLLDTARRRKIVLERVIPDRIDAKLAAGLDVLEDFKLSVPSPMELALGAAAHSCVHGDSDYFDGRIIATNVPQVVVRMDRGLGITCDRYGEGTDMSFAVKGVGRSELF